MDLRPKVHQWPTMRANDAEKRGAVANDPRNGLTCAEHWETPSVAVTDGTRLTRGGDRSSEMLLSGQAAQVSARPTPAARDHKGANSTDHLDKSERPHMGQLPNFVEHAFSPPAQMPPHGERLSDPRRWMLRLYLMLMSPKPLSRKRLRAWVSRVSRPKLNPSFVEWMHGWPAGWTDLEREVTGFPAWLQASRGQLSRLLLPVMTAERSLLEFDADLINIDPCSPHE